MGFPPSCETSTADNGCVLCAKASCCDDYQACGSDTNCSCLVGCLAMGSSKEACIATCGPYDTISTSTTACLDTQCTTECPNAGDMASGMCAQSTGTGTGAGGSPSCTPGSAGAGEACLSDADCASCECSNDFCN